MQLLAGARYEIHGRPCHWVQDKENGFGGANGITTTTDVISDAIDWKVGAASLAVAMVLWYIFT